MFVSRFFSIPRLNQGVAFLIVASCLAGCSLFRDEPDQDIVAGVDLDEAFAPARADEIRAAAASWSTRDVAARGVELVDEDTLASSLVVGWRLGMRAYAHDVGGIRHYGAVLTPLAEPGKVRQVLLYLHGGDQGTNVPDVVSALALFPKLRNEFVVVVPSYRSEPLRVGDRVFRSGGAGSPWDYDVDDTLALLNVALVTTPEADSGRVAAVGFSRGSTVGLLAAIRDSRIGGVIGFFGPTDFLGPFARDVAREMLLGNSPNLPGIDDLNTLLMQPFKRGELGVQDVRLGLIQRSPVYFVDRLPMVQIHHGVADRTVPVEEGRALAAALAAAGHPEYEAWFYEGAGHDPFAMPEAFDRLRDFLLQWIDAPPA